VVNPVTGEIRWIHSAGQVIYTADGTPIHFDGIHYDITERKEIDEKLRQSERHLIEAQKLANLGSWQWDSITDEVTGSDEFYRIFGNLFSSYQGFLDLIHPDDLENVKKAVQDTLEHQSLYNIYYRIMHHDGSIKTIHAQGQAITNNIGKVIGRQGPPKM
jgi:PAS domain-containing protein